MSNETSKAYRHLELQNQTWLNQRVAWIVKEFGLEQIKRVECSLPTSKRFAEYRGGSDEEVIQYFRKITSDIGLDPETIVFSIEDHLETDEGVQALGMYWELDDGLFSIAMAAHQLSDPLELAATLVHELCHVYLLGHRRIDVEAHDHEPLTDLLGVFMGYGIIQANSVIHDQTDGVGAYRERTSGRQGYMTMSMFGYALALFAALRNEDGSQWLRHMRADVRDAFSHSQRFFQRNGLPDLSIVPDTYLQPILTLDSTLQPPPTDAMATFYKYSVDPEIPEDVTDYRVDQTQGAHDSDGEARAVEDGNEPSLEDPSCVYCGSTSDLSSMTLPALDESIVCGPCRASIEEGAREAADVMQDDARASQFIGIMLFASLAFAAFLIVWSLVAAAWQN